MNDSETEQIKENLRRIMAEKGIRLTASKAVPPSPKTGAVAKLRLQKLNNLKVRSAVLWTVLALLSAVALIQSLVGHNKNTQSTSSIKTYSYSEPGPPKPPIDPVAPSVVRNEGPAGTVWQVTEYVLAHLKDPDSFRTIKWGNVVETSGKFAVRLNYRAKNSFGGLVVSDEVFFLDEQGHVIGSMTIPGTQ